MTILQCRIMPLSIVLLIGLALSACTKRKGEQSVLNADQSFTFPAGFPPDPGEAGRKTLVGIDSDRDGVRDDIQRWIFARYPKDEPKRNALRKTAIAYQESGSRDLGEQELMKSVTRFDKAIACLMWRFPDGQESYLEMEMVKARALNTKERTDQFLSNDSKLDGRVFDGSDYSQEEACRS